MSQRARREMERWEPLGTRETVAEQVTTATTTGPQLWGSEGSGGDCGTWAGW